MKKILLSLIVCLMVLIPSIATAGLIDEWPRFPDIHKGLALQTLGVTEITPTIALELYTLDCEEALGGHWFGSWLGTWNIDAGVGDNLVFGSISRVIVPVIDLQLGAFFGYDFSRDIIGFNKETQELIREDGFEAGLILSAILF